MTMGWSMDYKSFSAAGVVAPHPLAAAAGRDVLIEGGSVIEAALAAAMVSAVVVPDRAGLGGDALWMIRDPGPRGRVRMLDARGTVAAAARLSFYRQRARDTVPEHGPEAVLVAPGVVAGWIEVHGLSAASGGRLPLSRLLAPAIVAARDGWDLSAADLRIRARAAPTLSAMPGFAEAFPQEGAAPEASARRFAPALAATLDHLAGSALEDFYTGDVARELAADLEAWTCPLDRVDLRRTAARWRESHALDLGRYELCVPPTRSGLCAAVSLGLADAFTAAGLDTAKGDGFGRWHGLIEACRAAEEIVADADASDRDPADLLDAARLARFVLTLDPQRARRAAPPAAPLLPEAAAWIGAVDRDGAAVAAVHTIGGAFGSGLVSGRTGVLMGNRGAALAIDPDLGPVLRPGRRVPLASLPALLSNARDGRVAALGASGERAPDAVVQVADRILRGRAAAEAIASPRFALGATPDGREAAVLIEEDRDSCPVAPLRSAGHQVDATGEPRVGVGLAMRDGTGRVSAAADDGTVAGV